MEFGCQTEKLDCSLLLKALPLCDNKDRYLKQRPQKKSVKSVQAVAEDVRNGGNVSALCLKHARQVRDELQREAAKRKALELYKSKPKRERMREIQERRDKRNPIRFQSGRRLAVAGLGLTTVGLVAIFRKLRKFGNKLSHAADTLINKFQEVVASLKKAIGKVLWAVPFVMAVHYLLNRYCKGAGIAAIVVTALAYVVGPKIWNVVSNFFPAGELTFQSGGVETMSKLLASLFTFSVFKRKMSPATVSEFVKRISTLDRMRLGWDSFITWTMGAIETLINFVRIRFGKERISIFKKARDPVREWADEIDRLSSTLTTTDVDADTLDKMVDLVRTGYGFKELYRGTTMSPLVDKYVISAVNLLQPYMGALNARNNFRFEPSCAMFLGEPGIGKTLMAMPLCSAIMLLSGLLPEGSTSEDVAKNVWQKGTSEYWNGYANQVSLVMDDAFQNRTSVQDKENDFITLIRMVGTWSFPLNFADLASKGRVYFGSKFIFGTTNVTSIKAEAGGVLAEPAAVVRRLNHPYKLRIKAEFVKDGKLDYAAFTREKLRCQENNQGLDRFPWHIWEAATHDYLEGRTMDDWKPLREVICDIVVDLKRRKESFSDMKEFLDDFVSGFNAEVKVDSSSKDAGTQYENVEQAGRELDEESNFSFDCRPQTESQYEQTFEYTYSEFIQEEVSCMFLVKEFLKGFAIGLAVFVAIKIALAVLQIVFTSLFEKKESVNEEQSNRPLRARSMRPGNDVAFQAIDTTVVTNVYANSYKMYTKLDTGATFVLGQVQFLVGELAVQPRHFTHNLHEMILNGEITRESMLYFRNAMNEQHVLKFTVGRYLDLKRYGFHDSDVEFLHFGVVRAHRNVVRSYIKEADVKHLGGINGRLDICEIDDKRVLAEKNHRLVHVSTLQYGEDLRVSGKHVKRYFNYKAPTSVGDCGAALSMLDNGSYSGRTVIGMHVAGSSLRQVGYATIVTQEMIEQARISMDIANDKFVEDIVSRGVDFQSGNELPFNNKGSFLAIGESTRVNICMKSAYYPTDLYGRFGEYSHLPARLSPVYKEDGVIYPMENAVKNYASPLLIYEQPWLSHAVHVAMKPFVQYTIGASRRIYTFEEAIIGVPEEKFRSLPRGTAAGYPYVLEVTGGKKAFFGVDDKYDLTGDKALELRERVNYIIESAKRNERLSNVFVDFLKDELRPAHKVSEVATRLISSAPLDYTVAWRMYFGAISAAFMRHNTVTGMCPGICAYSDWPTLANVLTRLGDDCFDGDFKAFDSSEQPSIHDEILDFINRWYNDGEENARIRRVLWLDLVHSRHIGGLGMAQQYVYQWNKSLPSGHPFTTVVNSMYSLITLVSAYIHLTKNMTDFWNNVSPATFGDDNVANVHASVKEVYNQRTVSQALKDLFGLVYTPGDKSGEFRETFPIAELTFLKRGFVCEDNDWLCPLELESFLYVPYWSKNRKEERKMKIAALETALEELSMHPQETWDKYAPMISNVMDEYGHVSKARIDRMQYRMVAKSRTDNWY